MFVTTLAERRANQKHREKFLKVLCHRIAVAAVKSIPGYCMDDYRSAFHYAHNLFVSGMTEPRVRAAVIEDAIKTRTIPNGG